MHGFLLAGGTGSRLSPTTRSVNKHLLPVYDKPMIYYPLTTLLLTGITQVTVVTNSSSVNQFRDLLGEGEEFGISISYAVQKNADGLPGAILSALETNRSIEDSLTVLGDNIFHGAGLGRNLGQLNVPNRANVLAIEVKNPEDFGVAIIDKSNRVIDLVEKPLTLISSLAIPGYYYLPKGALSEISSLKKSARGELEITDLLKIYLAKDLLTVHILDRGSSWFDGGTISSLMQASEFVKNSQFRLGQLIGSPHEAAMALNLISPRQVKELCLNNPNSEYWTLVDTLL